MSGDAKPKVPAIVLIAALVMTIGREAAAQQPPAAAAPAASADAAQSEPRIVLDPAIGGLCIFAGKPPADVPYKEVRRLKVGKGSYGGVKDILPRFGEQARGAGADAVIDYSGSQRFGLLPWRFVRPVVHGTGIQWTAGPSRSCAEMGGMTLQAILDNDTAPLRQ